MRYIFYTALVLLLTSCSSAANNYYTQTDRNWRGRNMQDLLKSWGTPYSKITIPNGNTLLVYKTDSYRSDNAPASPEVGVHFTGKGAPILTSGANPNSATSWGRTNTVPCYVSFEANANGTIINTHIAGAGCYSGFAMQRRNPN